MCYTGICKFERIDGECALTKHSEIIRKTGFSACFIAGTFFESLENEELYEELAMNGKLKEFTHIIDNIQNQKLEELDY